MSHPILHCGIGLRQPHYREFLACRPALGFVEVHSENFFNPHEASSQILQSARELYPVSLHGVGLSLGSACGIDCAHLDNLAQLVQRIDPVRVSDHASFARGHLHPHGIVHANDLLPVAFTEEELQILCSNVQQVQDRLQRPILVENLSSYLHYLDQDYSEPAYFAQLCQRTGCQLLLDVNNLLVNALNDKALNPVAAVCGWIDEWIRLAPAHSVGEIHLAGFSPQPDLIVDDHAAPVSAAVWQAYAHAIRHLGQVPVLVEWDEQLPEFTVLLNEASKAAELARMVLHEQTGLASHGMETSA